MIVISFQAMPLRATLNIIKLTVHIFLSQPCGVYTVKYGICSPRTDIIKHLAATLDAVFDSGFSYKVKQYSIIFFAPIQFDNTRLICYSIFLHLNKNKLKCLEQGWYP